MEAATPTNVEYVPLDHPGAEWLLTPEPSWSWDDFDYRIKPEPKYRPWTIDEVPVGAVVRRKANGNITVGEPSVITKVADSRIFCGDYTAGNDCRALFLYAEVSYDFGKTWQPCGVLES